MRGIKKGSKVRVSSLGRYAEAYTGIGVRLGDFLTVTSVSPGRDNLECLRVYAKMANGYETVFSTLSLTSCNIRRE